MLPPAVLARAGRHAPGRLVLTGRPPAAAGAVTDLARALQPSVIIFEDAGLAAGERRCTCSPPAVAACWNPPWPRGRAGIAAGTALPGAPARERLLTLYGQNAPLDLTQDDAQPAVRRTDGTTASFLKELIRRSVLEALQDDPALPAVTGAHLARALDDLLDAAQAVTRTLLGAGIDPAGLPPGGALAAAPGPAGWIAYGHQATARRIVRYRG